MNHNSTQVSRRDFLAVSGAAAAVLAAQGMANSALATLVTNETAATVLPMKSPKPYPIGLELYSVRDELARDLPNTLRTVARMGYEAVEFYAPYFNWTIPHAKEVRALLDEVGLRCYSTHNNFESFTPGHTMDKAMELNQILGARFVILASEPPGIHGLAGWEKLCAQLTHAAEQFQPQGLAAGFHNHGTEWAKLEGDQRIMDFIAAHTPPEFVLQLDVGTCVQAGADPVAWITAHPGRIKIAHLKDWAPGSDADEKGYRVLFGEGVSPWAAITAALEATGGVELYLLEQEGSRFSEFETARRCLDAWNKFRDKA